MPRKLNVVGMAPEMPQPPRYQKGQIVMGEHGCYMAGKDDEMTALAGFAIEITRRLSVEGDGEHADLVLSTPQGEVTATAPPGCWITIQAFKKWLSSLGKLELAWFGSDKQLQQLLAHIVEAGREVPRTRAYTSVGFHGGRFVTELGELAAGGAASGDSLVHGAEPSGCGLVHAERAIVPTMIHQFNHPSVSLPILGWAVACLWKDVLQQPSMAGGFPVLAVSGAAGSGKTQTAHAILGGLFATSRAPISIASLTPFAALKILGSSANVPVVFDEFKPGRMTRRRLDEVSGMVRASYNCEEGVRGRQDMTVRRFRYEGPMAILGESGLADSESAIADRCCQILMSSSVSRQWLPHFQTLARDRKGLAALGRALAVDRLDLESGACGAFGAQAFYDQCLALVDARIVDRQRANCAVQRFGLGMLTRCTGQQYDGRLVDAATLGAGDCADGARKSEVDRTLDTIFFLTTLDEARGGLAKNIHFTAGGSEVVLWLDGIHHVFLRYVAGGAHDGDVLSRASLKRQLAHEPYCKAVGEQRTVGGLRRRCAVLDVAEMLKKGTLDNVDLVPDVEMMF